MKFTREVDPERRERIEDYDVIKITCLFVFQVHFANWFNKDQVIWMRSSMNLIIQVQKGKANIFLKCLVGPSYVVSHPWADADAFWPTM